MLLSIKKYPNPILKIKADKVDRVDATIKELIKQMKEIMKVSDGAGLAAPQIGISKQIIIINTKNGAQAFINPEIIEYGKKKKINQEGCLSFPGLWLKIVRPDEVKVKALDENGKEIIIEAKSVMALVFQHEIDHINGIQFIERASLIEKIKAQKVLSQLRRDYGINRKVNRG